MEATVKRTQEALELEKRKMIAEAKNQIVDVVAAATERIVAKTLKSQDKERLVKEAIKEIQG